MPSATLTYTVIPKYLKAMVYYAYFNQEGKSGKKNVHQHRYQVGLTGSYATPHLNFSLCSKFEQTHKDGIPNNKWRNQVKITGTIAKEKPVETICIGRDFRGHEQYESDRNSRDRTYPLRSRHQLCRE